MVQKWMKWVPALVVPVLVASAAVAVPLAANAAVSLPDKTPAEVLAMAAQARVNAFSGTVEQTSDLGLPQLPSTGGGSNSAASSAIDLLSGTHTARVYVDGRTNLRVQVLDKLAERDVIRHGTDLWAYDSKGKKVVHSVLPNSSSRPPASSAGDVLTPDELAKKFLASIDSSTKVAVASDLRVAARTAYDLVLTPKASESLLGSVSVAVDSKTGLPLRVQLTARGSDNAVFSVAFSSISFTKPDARLFAFTPPVGSSVTEKALPTKHLGSVKRHSDLAKPGEIPNQAAPNQAVPKRKVIGSGWDAVLALPAGTKTSSLTSSPLYNKLTSSVSGGRVFHTALVNVLVTNDGRIFAGSVPIDRLTSVASSSR